MNDGSAAAMESVRKEEGDGNSEDYCLRGGANRPKGRTRGRSRELLEGPQRPSRPKSGTQREGAPQRPLAARSEQLRLRAHHGHHAARYCTVSFLRSLPMQALARVRAFLVMRACA